MRNIWNNRPRLLFNEIRICIKGLFCPKQGQGFKSSTAYLYQIFVRVVPRLKDRFTYLLYTSTSEILTLSYAWSLKRYPFRAEPCLIDHYRKYPWGTPTVASTNDYTIYSHFEKGSRWKMCHEHDNSEWQLTIIPRARMGSASWAIYSESMRARGRGIIVSVKSN